MESTKIPILENIALVSIIMPYYSYTNKAFLLLSELCSRSREKLDEFYEEFRNSMRKYGMVLYYHKTPKLLYLPSDLFKFSVSIDESEDAEDLIKFIKRIQGKEGYYFNSHYMHKNITLSKIIIPNDHIEMFENYVEDIKEIKVFIYDKNIYEDREIYCNLIESIQIYFDSNYNDNEASSLDFSCLFVDEECTEIIPIFKSFRRVDEIRISFGSFQENLLQLELVK